MSEIIDLVTPLTRGIIWFAKDESDTQHPTYKALDYLLDGLLTANLMTASEVSSRVIIGRNFDKSFLVMIIREGQKKEIESFLTLLQKELLPENDILVLDESHEFEKMKNEFKTIQSQIRFIQ